MHYHSFIVCIIEGCLSSSVFFLFLVPMNQPVVNKAPSYPSSSQRAKDWNKIEAQIKKDEKDNKEDMGDANTYVVFSCLIFFFFGFSTLH